MLWRSLKGDKDCLIILDPLVVWIPSLSTQKWGECPFLLSVLSVQFTQSCLTLCDPMDCSTPGFPVHHQLLELAWTNVHQVGDTIQTPHTLSFPSPAFNLSQHQGLFHESALRIRWPNFGASASELPLNIQDWFPWGLTGLISLLSKGLSKVFSSTTIQTHQFISTQPYLWSNFCMCTWLLEKNHSFDYMDLCWQSDVSDF